MGQRYEGELIELLSGLDVILLDDYKNDIQRILSKELIENKTYEWLCEKEREDYFELIKNFK